MFSKLRYLAGGVIFVAVIVFTPIALKSTNQESTPLMQIGGDHSSKDQGHLGIQNLSNMPLAFTENQGQWDDRVLFRANAGGATMWFTGDGVFYQFTRRVSCGRQMSSSAPSAGTLPLALGLAYRDRLDRKPDSFETLMIKASFVGASPNPLVVGEEKMEYKCNYFLGNNPSAWRTDVPNYRSVRFEEIYPGIDLKYYGNGRQMEYDFVVSPGADYSQIRVSYDGCKSLSVDESGGLVVETEWGSILEQRPLVYQTDRGRRIQIQGAYVVYADHSFGFTLRENYDPSSPLIIDPVLVYSTYLGGDGYDWGRGIAVDGSGNAYVTGYISSTDFPTTPEPYQINQKYLDVFVTKLSSAGNGLVYSTYLGGDDSDWGVAIAVDGNGNAYITGQTLSADFPTTLNTYQTDQPDRDAFVTKINRTGNGLVYSTYLGGDGIEYGKGIAVDAGGNAHVTGETDSGDFPTENPYQTNQPGQDAFVTKLNSTGDGILYSTYLGGDSSDWGTAVAIDAGGNAYVTGGTSSSDFPTQDPYQTDQPDGDAFVTKLNGAGNGLVYSTYLGGEDSDCGEGIAVDTNGNAYVTGRTYSSDFPIKNPYQTDQPGQDCFVTKLNSAGNGLAYSTYLGGDDGEVGWSIALDDGGNAFVTGNTSSANFPTRDPYQVDQPWEDVFVAKLNTIDSGLVFSTYLGGNAGDYSWGIAVDGSGYAYVTGWTFSSDFPTQNPYQTDQPFRDVFVTKISPAEPNGDTHAVPDLYLYQNYPNPFNPNTNIHFTLTQAMDAQITIYDILGRQVRQLVARHYSAGTHVVRFDGKNDNNKPLSSGIYFYRVQAGDMIQSKKMVLLK